MLGHTFSRTAVGAAVSRFVHQLRDQDPKILDDPIIEKLTDKGIVEKLKENESGYDSPQAAALRSHIVLRSRFAEDCLKEAYEKGIRQYVIMGAGFDTFAYRQPSWAKEIKIFEVDHPSTQQEKRNRLVRAGIEIPNNVIFVPVDFESTDLETMLKLNGFQKDAASFISWLGVVVYLSKKAIVQTLKWAASCPRQSEIVFSFSQKRRETGVSSTASRAASAGEPWKTFFTLKDIEKMLKEAGFSTFNFLDAELAQQYFLERKDDLLPPKKISVVRAIR